MGKSAGGASPLNSLGSVGFWILQIDVQKHLIVIFDDNKNKNSSGTITPRHNIA
jgi:hypothetical protein